MKGLALKYIFYIFLIIIFVVVAASILIGFFDKAPDDDNYPPIVANVTYECIRLNETIIDQDQLEQIIYGFMTDQCYVFHANLKESVTFEDIERMVRNIDEDRDVFKVDICRDLPAGTDTVLVDFDRIKTGVLITMGEVPGSNTIICENLYVEPAAST